MRDEDAVQVVGSMTAARFALDAGVPLGGVRDMLRHVDRSTSRRYGRSRHSLDRHPTGRVAAHIATGAA